MVLIDLPSLWQEFYNFSLWLLLFNPKSKKKCKNIHPPLLLWVHPSCIKYKTLKTWSKNFAWLFVIVSETKQMSLSKAHSMLQCSFKRKQDFLHSDTLPTPWIYSLATHGKTFLRWSFLRSSQRFNISSVCLSPESTLAKLFVKLLLLRVCVN